MWWILLFSVCSLEWTTGQDLCPNDVIQCEDSYCPGGKFCNYDRSLPRPMCTPQCSSDPDRDPCTCLATYKGCHIQQNATDAVSRPMFGSVLQTTYSCVNTSADKNCNYDVHVLSAHQGNGDSINWNTVLGTGDINVDISYNGKEVSNKSLVLVLLSHYPMNWILNVPTNVTIDKVLLSSYHVDVSGVVYPAGSVLSVEKVSNILLPSLANGFDAHGNHTLQALQYLTKRFGSISSFTGTYRADRFTMNISRSAQHPGCPLVQRLLPIPRSPSPVISAQCHPLFSLTRGVCYINSFRATCSGDGYCRCPNLQYRDECTCLVKFGSCAIEKTAHGDNSVGVPSYRRRTQITSSCVANDNCQNSVHVISVYEARSTGFSVQSGSISVHVSVTGQDTKPLILVLTSYYPIRWSLSIPSGVVFDKVIVSSYYRYLSQTSVGYTSGRVISVEKVNCSRVQCYADGYDDDTVEQLQYLSRRFGPVSSWSSAYRTDTWSLNIKRRAGCTLEPIATHGRNHSSSCPVIPFTSVFTTRPPPTSSTNELDSFTNPFTSVFTTRPPPTSSTNELDSFTNPFTNHSNERPSVNSSLVGQAIAAAVILSVIVLVIAIITIVVVLMCHKRAKWFSHNQVIHAQQNSNHYSTYARTSPTEQACSKAVIDWTGKAENTSEQVLMDSAPPAYHVALKFLQPSSKSEDPPPYPG